MGIYTQIPDHLNEVDVIIAGGGTAACIIAARLSESDPNLSVLVIEGGQNNLNNPTIIHPLFFLNQLLPTSKATLFYQSKAEPKINGRDLAIGSGGILGGGSSINLMIYSRAQRQDWDSWKTPGWTADEMIPFLKRLETYHGHGPKAVHGDSGPIQITTGTYNPTRIQDQFIQAANELGYPEVPDIQDMDTNNGVQRALRYIGPDGRRQDTAHRYLHPKLQDDAYPNLHVLVENQVSKIVFEGKRAVGVEYRANPAFQPDATTTPRIIRAKRLVVGSCGALGTPLLLERSGLGDPEILNSANVPVIASLPEVGKNYQDHHLLTIAYHTALEQGDTLDALLDGREDAKELMAKASNTLGWNVQDITSKIRPTEADVRALGPEYEAAYERDFKHNPNKPVALVSSFGGLPAAPASLAGQQHLVIPIFTAYPYSRGHIHITSPDLGAKIDFETGFLNDPLDLDVKTAIWMYKKQRELVRRMETYRGEVAERHPLFAQDSPAATTTVKLDGPLENVSNIEYSSEDDAAIEDWVRDKVTTTWHSLGTCKMGPSDQGGVVGANLDVHGIENLKLADLSIAPENLGTNTACSAMAIGENAASIIIAELGLNETRS